MIVAVHNHFNARKLCDMDLPDDVVTRLKKPPPLKDNWVELPNGQRVNALKPEDHVVEIGSGSGLVRLFMAKINTVDHIVTNTPAAAIARAA